KIDTLDFYERDLDPPWIGVLVQNLLQALVQLLALAQQVVQSYFAEHRTKRRLRQHRRRIQIIFYFDDGPAWVHHPKINDCVHFDCDVVFGDDVLCRNIHRNRAETHANDAVDRPENPDQAGTLRLRKKPADAEDDTALVLAKDVQRIEYPDGNDG